MNFLANQVVTLLIVVVCITVYVHSATLVGKSDPYRLVQYESTDTENGHKFSYDTEDGQSRDEELVIKNKGTDEEEIIISGSYSFKGTDGLIYTVTYTADRNGYHAVVRPPQPDLSATRKLSAFVPAQPELPVAEKILEIVPAQPDLSATRKISAFVPAQPELPVAEKILEIGPPQTELPVVQMISDVILPPAAPILSLPTASL